MAMKFFSVSADVVPVRSLAVVCSLYERGLSVFIAVMLICALRVLSCCTGALQIEQSEESDQGKYECVATNNDGTRYSAPANLYVRGRKSSLPFTKTSK